MTVIINEYSDLAGLFETHYLNINPKHYITGKLIWYVTCDWWLIKMAVIYTSIGSICMNPNHRNTHIFLPLQWHHNGGDGVSNHKPHDCLLNRLFRRRSKKTSMVVTGLCAGKSPVTGEFLRQRASNAENISIWWRHHASRRTLLIYEQAMISRCRFHRRQTYSMSSATTMLYIMRTRISDCTPRYSVGCLLHIHAWDTCSWRLGRGWGLLNQFPPSVSFPIVKTLVTYWISHSYLTGVAAA